MRGWSYVGLYTVNDFNIYGYDIFYINEISLSLPATTYTLINPMTRSQSRLSLNMRAAISCPPWYSPPAARARAERRSEFKAGTLTAGFSQGLRQQVVSQFLWT